MPLQIALKIIPENWMLEPPIKGLFDILQGSESTENPQALLVGGCVRNILIRKSVEDIDIATPLKPDDVVKRLENSSVKVIPTGSVKVIPTGIDHGTVTAVIDGQSFEITTLRHDVKTDGRHALVDYTTSWEEDAKRRDFTINTLLMDLSGNIYDPIGTGLKDIQLRKITFVGNAEKRIKEDYLRILRFFRFSAIYGDGFDVIGLESCRKMTDGINTLSRERVTQEFMKMLIEDNPADVMNVMFENNILKALKFKEYDPNFLNGFCKFQKRYNLISLASRLFVFSGLNMKNVEALQKTIILPKVFLKDMKHIHDALNLPDLSCDSVVREAVYRFGRIATAQALMIELMQDRVMNAYAPKALDIVQNWDSPMLPLSGNDLLGVGVQKGPEIGLALKKAESIWIENNFSKSKNALLEAVLDK